MALLFSRIGRAFSGIVPSEARGILGRAALATSFSFVGSSEEKIKQYINPYHQVSGDDVNSQSVNNIKHIWNLPGFTGNPLALLSAGATYLRSSVWASIDSHFNAFASKTDQTGRTREVMVPSYANMGLKILTGLLLVPAEVLCSAIAAPIDVISFPVVKAIKGINNLGHYIANSISSSSDSSPDVSKHTKAEKEVCEEVDYTEVRTRGRSNSTISAPIMTAFLERQIETQNEDQPTGDQEYSRGLTYG